ncbi:hypothetical protein GEMRC1_011342 [Eukaryota sp. GEM-RC1]
MFYVVLCEFDIKEGAVISCAFPEELPVHSSLLCDVAIPDGLHNSSRETSFTIHNKWSISSTCSNIRDSTVSRGAIMKSILIISSYHYPSFFISLSSYILNNLPSDPDATLALFKSFISLLTESFSSSYTSHLTFLNRVFTLPASTSSLSSPIPLSEALLPFNPSILRSIFSLLFSPTSTNLNSRTIGFYAPSSGHVCSIVWTFRSLLSKTNLSVSFHPYVPLSAIDDVLALDIPVVFGTSNQVLQYRNDVDLWALLGESVGKLGSGKTNFKFSRKICKQLIEFAHQGRCDSFIIKNFSILVNEFHPQLSNSTDQSHLIDELDFSDTVDVVLLSKNIENYIIQQKQLFSIPLRHHFYGHLGTCALNYDKYVEKINYFKIYDWVSNLNFSVLSNCINVLLYFPIKFLTENPQFFEKFCKYLTNQFFNFSIPTKLSSLKYFTLILTANFSTFQISNFLSAVLPLLFEISIEILDFLNDSAEMNLQSAALDVLSLLLLFHNISNFLSPTDLQRMSTILFTITVCFNSPAFLSYTLLLDFFFSKNPFKTPMPNLFVSRVKSLEYRPSCFYLKELVRYLLVWTFDLESVSLISSVTIKCLNRNLSDVFPVAFELLTYCFFFNSVVVADFPKVLSLLSDELLSIDLGEPLTPEFHQYLNSIFKILFIGMVVAPSVRPLFKETIPFLEHEQVADLATRCVVLVTGFE